MVKTFKVEGHGGGSVFQVHLLHDGIYQCTVDDAYWNREKADKVIRKFLRYSPEGWTASLEECFFDAPECDRLAEEARDLTAAREYRVKRLAEVESDTKAHMDARQKAKWEAKKVMEDARTTVAAKKARKSAKAAS